MINFVYGNCINEIRTEGNPSSSTRNANISDDRHASQIVQKMSVRRRLTLFRSLTFSFSPESVE